MRACLRRQAGFCLLALASFALGPLAFGEDAVAKYYAEDIKAAMVVHIAARVDDDEIFRLRDDVTGEMLELKFVKVHDPVRQIDDGTYFACTDFHVVGEPDKLYDLDFWLHPEDGVLVVHDEKVHKEPRHSFLYGWYKQPRYTFVNDEIVSLY